MRVPRQGDGPRHQSTLRRRLCRRGHHDRHRIKTPVQARANAICGRVIGTIRRECLDHMVILGRRHLEAVLAGYVAHYNARRPLAQHPPSALDSPPTPIDDIDPAKVRRTDRLGGLVHDYRMVA
ncbi:MAG: integrase core domain-containing protein [Actinomycetota bacterium]|nr:integrase core domain-containing protein [Actinomycetota bacterium]